ncbi:hypothetical protein N7539_007603 [Penicillium diatomitis]|uniref:Uncharacterized protein n=1 Tax=Penicillium diatomitis TaxID=2819901 RepID=A0A9W9WVE5_9EURO|nr:uncharacterized protein N7539_007603 [Penicillium diatomitis]KAJ5477459.1 hypothetical protein N7539_007603 [Penicillium diatomitis]
MTLAAGCTAAPPWRVVAAQEGPAAWAAAGAVWLEFHRQGRDDARRPVALVGEMQITSYSGGLAPNRKALEG